MRAGVFAGKVTTEVVVDCRLVLHNNRDRARTHAKILIGDLLGHTELAAT